MLVNFWQTATSEKLIRVVIKYIAHKGAMVCGTTETLWMKKKWMMSFKSLAIKYTRRQSIKWPLYLKERAFFVTVLLIHSDITKTTRQYRRRWGQQLLLVFFPAGFGETVLVLLMKKNMVKHTESISGNYETWVLKNLRWR